jgi:hypothetical protein
LTLHFVLYNRVLEIGTTFSKIFRLFFRQNSKAEAARSGGGSKVEVNQQKTGRNGIRPVLFDAL